MKKRAHEEIRAYLLERGTGSTVATIAEDLDRPTDSVRQALKAMPDTFIDRWVWSDAWLGKWIAVWDVVKAPENCQKPAHSGGAKERRKRETH